MKLKIVNKRKFVNTVLIILGIISLLSMFLCKESFSYKENNYKKIYVNSGDTLWNIAKEELDNNINYEGKDIREIINSIKSINGLQSSELSIGQELLILE